MGLVLDVNGKETGEGIHIFHKGNTRVAVYGRTQKLARDNLAIISKSEAQPWELIEVISLDDFVLIFEVD